MRVDERDRLGDDDMDVSALLREDNHVHSTFSDGASTLEENLARAERLGLTRLGCVDHVRVDTTYVPAYVAAVRALRPSTRMALTVGIEAKILDTRGTLDLPPDGLDGVDFVYVADHQFPWTDGPRSPRVVKEWLESGELGVDACLETLVEATVAAMHGHGEHPLVLAHLFSILPKLGLSEEQVPDPLLDRLAEAAAATGTVVEVSERWRCPSVRALRAARRAGAEIVCSTDSHAADSIGRYGYVASTLEALAG